MHLLGNKRKIGKKSFKAVSSHSKKRLAEQRAKTLRNRGYEARIVPSKTKKHGIEYYVWRSV